MISQTAFALPNPSNAETFQRFYRFRRVILHTHKYNQTALRRFNAVVHNPETVRNA